MCKIWLAFYICATENNEKMLAHVLDNAVQASINSQNLKLLMDEGVDFFFNSERGELLPATEHRHRTLCCISLSNVTGGRVTSCFRGQRTFWTIPVFSIQLRATYNISYEKSYSLIQLKFLKSLQIKSCVCRAWEKNQVVSSIISDLFLNMMSNQI